MSLEPAPGYTRLDGGRIAYQVIGDGSVDLLITAGYWGSFDVEWEDPMVRLFYERLATFARVIRFDRLGTGASDGVPLDALPPWEAFADEIESVLDAVGSQHAALFVISDAGPAGMLFAATRPGRCRALVLFNSSARYLAADDYPIGYSVEEFAALFQPTMEEGWGTEGEGSARLFFPSRADDPRFVRWVARLQRNIASPDTALRYSYATMEADGRPLLTAIRVPTLVLSRIASPALSVEHGRYLSAHIEGARFVELPGGDSFPYWENPELTLDSLEELLLAKETKPSAHRTLASILFTDIVDSTKRAEAAGDSQWRAVLNLHDATARTVLEGFGGRLVKSTGDGVLGTLDGPGRAIRAATELRYALGRLGLQIRTGIHTGEIEIREADVAGIAVHVAARVMSAAAADEIMVTGTVKELVTGSGISFEDRGTHSLKGIEGRWQLYAVGV